MKSLSIHGVDDELEKKIGERAKSEGKSVNKVVKELLAKALGPEPRDKRANFADLCGVWTEEEAAEFMRATADFNVVEPKDWT